MSRGHHRLFVEKKRVGLSSIRDELRFRRRLVTSGVLSFNGKKHHSNIRKSGDGKEVGEEVNNAK